MNHKAQPLVLFDRWRDQLEETNIRGLIIAAPGFFNDSPLFQWCEQLTEQRLYLGSNDEPFERADIFLGSETKAIIFDSRDNFDANNYAACSGTLVGGGILVLVVNQSVFDYALSGSRFGSRQQNRPSTSCPLLARVIQHSMLNRSTAFYDGNGLHALVDDTLEATDSAKAEVSRQSALTDQQDLIDKVQRVAQGHANRPLVITASRGRGKSAALGIAAARLVKIKPLRIIVTAPRKGNLTSFYRHLDLLQPEPLKNSGRNKRVYPNGAEITFVPPDQIIKIMPQANLLLIDEAAALPVNLLTQLTTSYNRIVFATTSDGYEGNGKGFEVRFKQNLLAMRSGTRFAQLTQPMRWSIEDQLEAASYRALLLNCALPQVEIDHSAPALSAHFDTLSRQQLSENETDLRDIFALLINAHYQTRPADLQRILGDDNLSIAVLRIQSKIVGVALINHEGSLDAQASQAICEARLRLKGQLLPQSIMLNFGLAEAGVMRFYRVMRIAVHPTLQKRGLGSQLISGVLDLAKKAQADFVGASFAAAADVVGFWFRNGFDAYRLGSSKDSASGAHSLEVMRPLNHKADEIMRILTRRFGSDFRFKLGGELKAVDLELVTLLLACQTNLVTEQLSEQELKECRRFSEGKKGLPVVIDLLQRLFRNQLKNLWRSKNWSHAEIAYLVDAFLLQSEPVMLSDHHDLSGKKYAVKQLRELTAKLLCGDDK